MEGNTILADIIYYFWTQGREKAAGIWICGPNTMVIDTTGAMAYVNLIGRIKKNGVTMVNIAFNVKTNEFLFIHGNTHLLQIELKLMGSELVIFREV